MEYQCVTTDAALRAYLADAPVVAFDFETSPEPAFRVEARAALDAHRAEITGISLSVQEGSASMCRCGTGREKMQTPTASWPCSAPGCSAIRTW